MNFEDAVDELLAEAADRNFRQSVDFVLNVQNVDLNDPQNRFSEDVKLPHQADEDVTVCVIGETIINNADNADKVIDKDELDEYFEDQDKAKELAESYDFFIAEAPLMPQIGQELGPVFGPRNKMPDPMEPGGDPSEEIEALRSTIAIQLKDSPSVKCKIGHEEMDPTALAANAETVYNTVTGHMPASEHNVKDVLLKLTMSSPVEVQ